MPKKILSLILVAGIAAASFASWRFFVQRITDRDLLVESLKELEKSGWNPRVRVDWDVFCQQAAQGHYDDAMKTLLLSRADPDFQYALVTLAKIRAQNGDPEGAIQTAREYAVVQTREKSFQEIAVAQARRGNARGARETASLLADPLPALDAVAAALAERRDLQGARETIAKAPSPYAALTAIGEYQVKMGDFQGALETAEEIWPKNNANLLFDIGNALRGRGELGRVRQLVSGMRNREVARMFIFYARLAQSTIENIPTLVPNTCEQAFIRAKEDGYAAAYELLENTNCWYSFLAVQEFGSNPDEAERGLLRSQDASDICFGLTEFAKVAAAAGRIADALRFLDAAQKICGQKDAYRLAAVREVARGWAIKEGPKPAVNWARSRSDPTQRSWALLGVAEAMGHAHP